MKKFYTLLFSMVCLYSIHAQYTAIPDTAFEQYLIDQAIDTEGSLDGQVLTSDIAIVNNLDLSSINLSSLVGIQDFTSLIYLKVAQDNITALDVSGLIALQELDLFLCRNLETLNISGCIGLVSLDIGLTSLNSLDLSTCTSISTIDMYKCGLEHLDVQGLTTLTSIDATESFLQTLNVSGCTSLTSVDITETAIQTLDLSNNSSITNLTLYDCQLQNLNLANASNLESLFINQCNALSNLDLTNCNNLKNINFLSSSNQLSDLDFSDFTALENLYIDGTSFTNINLSNSPNLTSLAIYESGVSSLDLRNGNNTNISYYSIYYTNLSCVNVDDEAYSTANWSIYNNDYVFSEDCATLNINENEKELNTIRIFPNPVIHTLYIDVKDNQKIQDVSIVNIEGKKILTSTEKNIDLSSLATGFYFAVITSNNRKIIKKLLKN